MTVWAGAWRELRSSCRHAVFLNLSCLFFLKAALVFLEPCYRSGDPSWSVLLVVHDPLWSVSLGVVHDPSWSVSLGVVHDPSWCVSLGVVHDPLWSVSLCVVHDPSWSVSACVVQLVLTIIYSRQNKDAMNGYGLINKLSAYRRWAHLRTQKGSKNAYLFGHGHTVCTFSGKSPLSSHKTTLKQQING